MNHKDAGGGGSMFWVQTVSTFYVQMLGDPHQWRSPRLAANESLKFVPQIPSAPLCLLSQRPVHGSKPGFPHLSTSGWAI